MPEYNFPCGGDLLLTEGDWHLAVAQSTVRLRPSKITHAMVVVSEAGVLHAVPGAGVALQQWSELWPISKFKALRPPKEHMKMGEFFSMVMKLCHLKYNYKIWKEEPSLSKDDAREAYFCSELVSKMFDLKVDRGLFFKKVVLPSDLVDLTDNWSDVTEVYRPYLFREKISDEKNVRMFEAMAKISKSTKKAAKEFLETQRRQEKIREFTQKQLEMLEKRTRKL